MPMGEPSRDTRDRENRRKLIDWDPELVVDDTRIEIHVGIEFARDEILVLQRDLFQLFGDFQERILYAYWKMR